MTSTVTRTPVRILHRGKINTRILYSDGSESRVPTEKVQSIFGGVVVATTVSHTKPTITTKKPIDQYSVDERFEFVQHLTDMVIKKFSPSLIVCGDAGIGKTYTVTQTVNDSGLVQMPPDFIGDDQSDYFIHVKGKTSPIGLYEILYNNRNGLIIFDDCDSVWSDATSINLLKAALDSYDERVISWNSPFVRNAGLPTNFEFKGNIIFISNLPSSRIDDAVKSRSFFVDISLSRMEIVERIHTISHHILPEIDIDLKMEVLTYMRDKIDEFNEVNIRTFLKCVTLRRAHPNTWHKMATVFA